MKYLLSKLEQRGYELSEQPFGYPGMVERGFPQKSLRIWVYPSFEPFVSFTVAKFRDGLFARRIVWDHRHQVLAHEPMTYCSEIAVSESVLDELIQCLAKIELNPYIPLGGFGIDGVHYGVTFQQFMSESTLNWWGRHPESWHELRSWHGEYINKINELFPECAISIEKALTSRSS